ncbi:MAG: SAM-dependent methyltransferase, partial [Pseudomonadota bacterium]
ARSGASVVRLKSGDPMLFGRAEEELAAAARFDIPVEVVPGITAASAAAAAMKRPLSERGATDRVVLATGTCRPGDAAPDVTDLMQPGTTVALYMATRAAAQIRARLLEMHFDPELPVDIVASASRRDEKIVSTTLVNLCACMEAEGISHPAILLFRQPKRQRRAEVRKLTA